MPGRPRLADPKVSLTLSVPKSLIPRLQLLAEHTPRYAGRTPNDIARGLLISAVNLAEHQLRQAGEEPVAVELPACRPRRARKRPSDAERAEELRAASDALVSFPPPPTPAGGRRNAPLPAASPPPPELDTTLFRTQADALAFLAGHSPLNSTPPPDESKRLQEAASLASWQALLPARGPGVPPDPEDQSK